MAIRTSWTSRARKFAAYLANPAVQTASQFDKKVDFRGGIKEKIEEKTSASSITVDPNDGSVQTVTLDTNATFNLSSAFEVGSSVTLVIKQDGTGSRTGTFRDADSNLIKFPSGDPTLTTDANGIDVVTIIRSGDSDYLGNIAQGFTTG